MNCTFFGHRDEGEQVKVLLRKTIMDLVKEEGVKSFLVGNNGNFDFYAQCVLSELKKEGLDISFEIVISNISEKALSQNQNATVFPAELENCIPKFAISKRNDWLIKNSSILIACVRHKFSNSSKLLEKAQKKGLRVINLAKEKAPLCKGS